MSNRPTTAEMTPGPGFRVKRNYPQLPQDIIQGFREFETPDISDILNRLYTMSSGLRNVVNHEPLVGVACTVKVYPGDNLMVHKALDIARPGDIVVVELQREQPAVLARLVLMELARDLRDVLAKALLIEPADRVLEMRIEDRMQPCRDLPLPLGETVLRWMHPREFRREWLTKRNIGPAPSRFSPALRPVRQ